jgi:hypothetical protein
LSPVKIEQLMSTLKMDARGTNVEAKNQIRSDSSLCGGENEAEKSVEAGVKECKAGVRLKKAPSSASGAGVTGAFKSASGEWSPLQQMWLESGVFGVGGADSWHPESPCVPICAFVNVGGANVQETCNKSAATAANAATLTANWTIERMPMCSSQRRPDNLNSTVSMLLADVVGSSVLSLENVYCCRQ